MENNRINILLVEDNPADARLVVEMFKECSDPEFASTHTERLEDALQMLEGEEFDAVLLDIKLPDSDGFNGLERIIASKPRLPVVMLTGVDDENMGIQALHKNASDYLVKGKIDEQLLSRSIRYAIERKKVQAELHEANARLAEHSADLEVANQTLKDSRLAALNLMDDAIAARRQAEQAFEQLRQSEERLRLVIESSRTGTWDWDVRTNQVIWNDILFEMLGLNATTEPVRAETFFNYIHVDDRERVEEKVKLVFEKGREFNDEFRIIRADGKVCWLLSRGELYRDESGKPVRITGVNYDISRIKFAEEKIRDIAKFPGENPYPVIRLSEDGTILYSNTAGLLFLKEWNCEIGQKVPERWQVLTKESLRYARMVVRKDTCGSHIFSFAVAPIKEGRYVNLYGRDVTVQEQIKELLRKNRDELEEKVKERTAELAKTVDQLQQEVEQRRRTEQSLRERTRDLDAYFSHTITPLVILDKEFNFIRVNKAYTESCQKDMSELVGRNHFEFFPHQENRRIFEEVVRSKTPYQTFARPFFFPDHPEWGVTFWDWTLVPVLDEGGEVEFLLFSLKDVTERERAVNEIRANRQELRELTAELQLAEEQERRRIAVDLHDSVGQLLALSSWKVNNMKKSAPEQLRASIEDLWNHLDEAIRKTRTLSFDLSPSSLYDLGFETAVEDLVDKMSKERHIRCSFENEPSTKPLTDDVKVLLYRSIRELLINSAKHAEAGLVKVKLLRFNSDICVRVEDDGKGFDAAIMNNESTKRKGFGLLSIRERLNNIGGQFEIESADGHGTKAILTVPLSLNDEEEPGRS